MKFEKLKTPQNISSILYVLGRDFNLAGNYRTGIGIKLAHNSCGVIKHELFSSVDVIIISEPTAVLLQHPFEYCTRDTGSYTCTLEE